MTEVINLGEEKYAFYHEVGLAITQWAHVEFALAGIVVICFRDTRESAKAQLAADGFMSIDSFRAKCLYVDTIISKQGLPSTEQANWVELKDRCERNSQLRGKLAHYWVMNDLNNKPGRRVMLLPRKPPTQDPRQKYPGAVCLRDVVEYRLKFVALMCALENFGDRLVPQEERFPKDREQPSKPQTLAQIRRKIYGFASRPPKS